MTPLGWERLKEKLKNLKDVEMPKVSREIGAAIAMGDLSENAEYHAAKERQGMIAAQIRQMEDKLSRLEVIDPAKLSGTKIIFGATVTVSDLNSGDESRFQIVGEDEADSKAGKISYSSPMARGLIGKEEGDEAVIRTPRGAKQYEILRVEYKG
jgi:transcription elongation factor GreA